MPKEARVTPTTSTNLDRLRVDFTGSLLRPARLQEVAVRYGRGAASAEELRQVQDECIREVIAKQEAHGMPVVSDGEFRRANFQGFRWVVLR
jgi:methionine synthase II (cobalamin-independent)